MSIVPEQVVMLAAGMGTRLGALGHGLPKAMFDAAGRTLLDRALDFAERLGARERIVVTGYGHELVASHLAKQARPSLRVFENVDYKLGNLVTLQRALPHVTGGFLVMNIDHVYPAAVADRIREAPNGEVTAFVDFDRELGADDMKVELAGRAIRSISKQLTSWDCGYVGMTYVPAARLAAYLDAVAAVRASVGDSANVERVLQQLADGNQPPAIADISGIGWYELDTPEDVARALPGLERLP